MVEERHEQLLREIGSSIRQQLRDVRPTGGRLAGTSDGRLEPKRPSLGPNARPFGGANPAANARSGTPASGGSGPKESRPNSAALPGLRPGLEPPHARSCVPLPHPLRARDGPTAARLVSALQRVALSSRSGAGLERPRRRLALGAGDGRPNRQQNAGSRSQRRDGTIDRSETAAGHPGSGSPPPRPAHPTGRTNAHRPGRRTDAAAAQRAFHPGH